MHTDLNKSLVVNGTGRCSGQSAAYDPVGRLIADIARTVNILNDPTAGFIVADKGDDTVSLR